MQIGFETFQTQTKFNNFFENIVVKTSTPYLTCTNAIFWLSCQNMIILFKGQDFEWKIEYSVKRGKYSNIPVKLEW